MLNKQQGPQCYIPSRGKPLLLVLSGPSGVGKDAVVNRMKELGRKPHYVVTVTTRTQRPGEVDGLPYHFLSQEEFEGMLAREELLEWAKVYGHLYGVPKNQIREGLAKGLDVIVKVDVQGATTIKRLVPLAVLIFLAPPSMEELAARLEKRETESEADLALRKEVAYQEMESLPIFDYMVINQRDQVDQAVAQIDAIITAEKCRVIPRIVDI
jgi:guanylate kinase